MILKTKRGLSFFQFPSLMEFKNLYHGIFTRQNGYSTKPAGGLNISFRVDDDPGAVLLNRKKIVRCVKTELVFAQQVHSADVLTLKKSDRQFLKAPLDTLKGDAMVTDLKGVTLVIQVADCQPVFLYDPFRQVVGNVHSGWRGSINNIIGRTIRVMESEFGCEARNLLAAVGPSLGPCCSEFIHFRTEIPRRFWNYRQKNNRFDFWLLSQDQLATAGVLRKNISISDLCTSCRTDLFFSYRKEKETGRFAAAIGLRNGARKCNDK